MARQALAAGVGRQEQYTTVYSGMEVEPFLQRPASADAFRASLRLPEGAILLTQISRLAELKGHEYILAAAEQLRRDERLYFCFVGDGRLRGQVEAEIARRGLRDRFRLTGLLPPADIPAVCHATDILLHCSLREGLARALPQAMLAGKPVISFDIDGAAEVVDERTGVLTTPGNVDELVAAVRLLVSSAEMREQLGAAGRELCRERFDWRNMVEQIERVYRRLLG
jgi:glycosyltransferase involved in cell wall biosynthesis